MPSLLEIGLANAVCAALLAVLAILASRVCRRPAVMHGLWLLVLVKLITPPLFSLPVRVLPPEEPTPVAIAPAAVAAPNAAVVEESPVTGQFLFVRSEDGGEPMVVLKLSSPMMQPVALPAEEPALVPAAAPGPEPAPFDWSIVTRGTIGIWLAGSALWFAVSILRMARFQRVLRHATPASPELHARATRLAGRLGLPRCPEILLVPGSVPPMLWTAIGRPKVYLPADLIDRLETTEGDTLLAHELAHLRRGDHWVRWLEFAVQGLFWWYPLVPFARRQVHAHEEECCDALVVGMLPAKTYAAAIVRTLDFLAGADPLPAHASALTRVAAMKQRLLRIMAGGVAGRLGFVSRLALLSLAAGALPMLPTLARTTAKPPVAVNEESDALDIAEDLTPEFIVEESNGGESATPRALASSRDGKLAIGLENHSIEIRDAANGRTIRVLEGHSGPVNCVAFSPDGKTLASGSSDRTARLWDSATGEPKAILKGHGHWVYALAFAPDGKTLASGGYDRSIRLWNVNSARCVAMLRGHEAAVRALAFAPDGRTLASGGGDRSVRLWDVPSRKLRTTLTGHTETVRTLAFAADGTTLASGGDDGTARMWDVAKGESKATLHGHSAEVTALAFAPWGPVLVTGGADRGLKLWDSATGRPLHSLTSVDPTVGLAFGRDGSLTTLGPERQVRRVALTRVTMPSEAKFREGRLYAMQSRVMTYRRATPEDVWEVDAPRMIIVEIRPETK